MQLVARSVASLLALAAVGWVATAEGARASKSGDRFDGYALDTLTRMVYVRGLTCRDCTEAEFRAMARSNAVRRQPD